MTPQDAHRSRGWVDPDEFHHRMRADPRFAAEMAICSAHGIPHSIFSGRVWPSRRAPYWLAEDRDKAVAYHQWVSRLCSGCGLHPLDWPSERDETYVGRLTVCHGCREQADVLATIPDKTSGTRRASMRVHLERRTPEELLVLEARERGDLPDD